MVKVGDTIKYNGKSAKVTEVRGTKVTIYVTDDSGGYHSCINIPDLNAYEDLCSFYGHNPVSSSTESLRYNSGKTQISEIDPNFILAMADVLTKSQSKYTKFNWQRPTKLSTPYDSLMRHILSFQRGENIDPDDGLPHLIKAAVNLMFMHYHLTTNPDYCDDRGFKKDKK
jgi:hypothetical protein